MRIKNINRKDHLKRKEGGVKKTPVQGKLKQPRASPKETRWVEKSKERAHRVNSPEFCTKCELILNKCSFDLMVLTLEHLHKEIISTQEQIKNIESQLSSTIPADKFNTLKKRIETNVTQHRRDIELKKRTKFQRDLEDYELNRVYQWQDKSSTKKSYRQDGYRSSMDYTTSDSDPERPGRNPNPGRFLGRQRRQGKRRGPDGGSVGYRNMDFTRVTRSQIRPF
ncbi:uncharacterized protein LOC143817686 [Ranitomeya variabilis]|uniref:uncharacterized protein LOC143817686 n=1 Tax=Ranitomeya variabilis TaxID=490064 RepID=UPI004056F55A